MFDNANDYRIKKQQVGKASNDRQMKKINPIIKGSFTVFVKYTVKYIAKHIEKNNIIQITKNGQHQMS